MKVEEVDVDVRALVGEGPLAAKKILLTMYYPDLVGEGGICMRYPVTQTICRTDEFWQEKLARDFGVMEGTAEAVRRGTTSWRSEYHRLFRDIEREMEFQELGTRFSKEDLNARSLANLKKVARKFNLKGYYKLKKAQLIRRLLKEVPEDELLKEVSKYPVK